MAYNKERYDALVDAFMTRRVVLLKGTIDGDMVRDVIDRLTELQFTSSAPIGLLINSPGGSVTPALTLCDWLSCMLKVPVRGIVYGECVSAATLILLHCSTRVSTPNATFLVHYSKATVNVPVRTPTEEYLAQYLAWIQSLEARICNVYMNRLTPPGWTKDTPIEERLAVVTKLLNRGEQDFNGGMNAQEALEVGLIEEIVTNNLGIFLK